MLLFTMFTFATSSLFQFAVFLIFTVVFLILLTPVNFFVAMSLRISLWHPIHKLLVVPDVSLCATYRPITLEQWGTS